MVLHVREIALTVGPVPDAAGTVEVGAQPLLHHTGSELGALHGAWHRRSLVLDSNAS